MSEPVPRRDLLDARLVVERGQFRLSATLRVRAGEVVALLGPNGAGKTTALRSLAGLTALTAGHIRLAGEVLDDPANRKFAPPQRRSVGVVFQDYLLFPHLTALENVAFGLRRRGMRRREAREHAMGSLRRVGLAEYAAAKPSRLSGGQAQRVALARALAIEPTLLLLDEPLAALDAKTRLETRAELRRHLAEHSGATMLVTHDPLDALVLADRLVIVEHGRVVQEGDAESITARPRTEYVARLVGLNLYRGSASGHDVTLPGGVVITTTDQRAEGEVFVAFPPSAVALHLSRPEGASPRNVWAGTVAWVQRHGDNLRVQLTGAIGASADITPAAAAQLRLEPGQEIWAAVKASAVRTYPASQARSSPATPDSPG